jgi:hypothetical protein
MPKNLSDDEGFVIGGEEKEYVKGNIVEVFVNNFGNQ